MVIRNRKIRRTLWLLGFGLFVIAVVAFQQGAAVVAVILAGCAVVSGVLAFRKLKCSQCGKALWEISAGLTNCPYCGTAYTDEIPTA